MGQTNDKARKPTAAKSGNAGNPSGGWVKGEFVDFELTVQQKEDLKNMGLDTEWMDGAIVELVEAGYRISIKYDEYNSAYAAFMQQMDSRGENFGFILSGRGSTPLKAVRQVLYKWSVVPGGDLAQFQRGKRREEFDD